MKKILIHFANLRAAEGVDIYSLSKNKNFKFEFYLEKDLNPYKLDFLENINYKNYRYSFWLIIYHYNFYKFLEKNDPDWIKSPHFFKGVPYKFKVLIKLLKKLFILGYVAKFLQLFKKKFNPYDQLIKKYDLIVSFTGIKDPHSDDVCRSANKLGKKILFIQTGWDNISSKPMIERPDFFGVWGLQSSEFLRSFHCFQLNNTFLIGSPRLYLHKKNKKTLLPFKKFKNKKIILFIGCGENFYDYPLLKKLNKFMTNSINTRKYQIIYKPHPVMYIKNQFNEAKFKKISNIYLWKKLDDIKYNNSSILSVTDFLISPYSTMSLEAYYYGIPVLNFYYNHNMHKEHDYNIYGRHINLFPIIYDKRNIETTSIKKFDNDFKKLIQLKKKDGMKIFNYCCNLEFKNFEQSLLFYANKILK